MGNTFTATVIVRSEPVGVSTPATQTVCSDEAITTIVLSTSNDSSRYDLSAGQEITRRMSQVLPTQGQEISAVLPNNVTGVDQTVTYTITPTGGNGCVGNTFTATVIVRSEPVGVSTPATQTVCSDQAITTDSSYYK